MPEAAVQPPAPLCDEVVELLGSGVVLTVGTRDAQLVPECVQAMGSRMTRDRRTVTVFVPRALLGATLANLEDNGQVAVNIVRPSDDKTIQLKGVYQGSREANEKDRALLELQRGGMIEQLSLVGLPRAVGRRLAWWPALAIDIAVSDVYVGTPGPGAGQRLTR
jgi:hypothetical protein